MWSIITLCQKASKKLINCHKIKFSILTRSIIINTAIKTTLNQSTKKIKSAMLSKIKKYVFTSNLQYYSRAKYIKNGVIYTLFTSHARHRLHSFFIHKKSITTSHFSHIGVIPLPASVAIRSRSSIVVIIFGHQDSFIGHFIIHRLHSLGH